MKEISAVSVRTSAIASLFTLRTDREGKLSTMTGLCPEYSRSYNFGLTRSSEYLTLHVTRTDINAPVPTKRYER